MPEGKLGAVERFVRLDQMLPAAAAQLGPAALAFLVVTGGSGHLVQLHAPSGQTIWVNPHEVASVREPLARNREHFAPGTKCVVVMVNGNIAVRDACDDVLKLLAKP